MKEKLTRNIELKILAAVFAVILWLIVVNIDDPAKSIQFSGVEVQILNAQELDKQGLCYDILDDSNYVTVTVTGRRSVIEEISKENITATADMKDLTSMNTLTIKASCNKSANELDSIKVNEENVKLEIEKSVKVTKRIKVETSGAPAEGYILGSRTMDINQVEISGPESIISTIEMARVVVDVSNATSGVSASVPIELYTDNMEKVDTSRITINVKNVNINQDILYTKDVDVEYEFYGEPAEGYAAADEALADVESVKICGRKALLDSIATIYVYGEKLSIEGKQTNTKFSIDLDDYLPSGTDFADKSENHIATVTAVIRKEVYIEISRDVKAVRIEGLPTGKKIEILDDNTYVKDGVFRTKIYGLSEKLGAIDVDKVPITLDIGGYMAINALTELAPGIYQISPYLGSEPGPHFEENCKLHVRISDL